MQILILTLAPVFAAGFAVQQLLEILTSILDLDTRESFQKYKKAILGVVSLVLGLILATNGYLKVLQPFFTDATTGTQLVTIPAYLEYIVTALVISAGTEGINSILKFLKYKKEETKTEAAAKLSSGTHEFVAGATLAPTPEALAAMNRK